MSNDKTLARDAMSRFAAQFGGIIDGFALLGSLGDIEAAVASEQQRLKDLQAQIADAQHAAATAERDLQGKREALERATAALDKVRDGELQLQGLQRKIATAQAQADAAESDARNKQRELDKINAALAKLHTASK
jgi:DNA repair ATPase RecN